MASGDTGLGLHKVEKVEKCTGPAHCWRMMCVALFVPRGRNWVYGVNGFERITGKSKTEPPHILSEGVGPVNTYLSVTPSLVVRRHATSHPATQLQAKRMMTSTAKCNGSLLHSAIESGSRAVFEAVLEAAKRRLLPEQVCLRQFVGF